MMHVALMTSNKILYNPATPAFLLVVGFALNSSQTHKTFLCVESGKSGISLIT
jgi:hypothetical protein